MAKTSAFKHRLTGATDEQLAVAVKLAEEMAEKLKSKYGAADAGVAPSAMLMVALRMFGKKLGYAGLVEFLRVVKAEVETGDLTELMTPEEREAYMEAGGSDQADPLDLVDRETDLQAAKPHLAVVVNDQVEPAVRQRRPRSR